jgi:hypothetical protein
VHIIVDQLGLSHFNFDDNDFRYYFYVHLNGLSFETFKPNATIVDWSKPTVGYISFNDQEAGRTFSITGNKNYIGFVERVFQVLEIDEEKAQKASVMFLKNAIIPPMEISCISMEEEALKRFI